MFPAAVKADTKTKQLCHQVEETISFALAASTSPLLRDLYVLGVEPLRGAAALRVLVAIEDENSAAEVAEALRRANGYLRGEVARAISRRRVPTLEYTIVPPRAGPRDAEPAT